MWRSSDTGPSNFGRFDVRTENLSKEKSSVGNVNEPQLSTSGFQMKEG
jgi:hypothetical protein